MTLSETRPGAWRASAQPSTPGFTLVPRLDGAALDAWVVEEVDVLRRLWGDAWRDDREHAVETILREAQRTADPATLFDLLYWPYALPVVTRVQGRFGRSVAVDGWRRHGYRLDLVEPGAIGTGVRCVRSERFGSGRDATTIVESHVVFDDGEMSVVVSVAPSRAEIAAHVVPGLAGILGTLEVLRADGSVFRGIRPAGIEIESEEWSQA